MVLKGGISNIINDCFNNAMLLLTVLLGYMTGILLFDEWTCILFYFVKPDHG